MKKIILEEVEIEGLPENEAIVDIAFQQSILYCLTSEGRLFLGKKVEEKE